MTTFSQLVDQMASETKRPDLLKEICLYLNQTIREVHFEPTKGNVAYYRDNLQELRLTVTDDHGFSWDIPKPSVFQGMRPAFFHGVDHRADLGFDRRRRGVWAPEMPVGPGMSRQLHYWYRSGTRVFFSNYGCSGSCIDIAWYEYPPYLQYFASPVRPAQYDEWDGWTYAPSITTPEQQAAAQIQCSNWLLLRWRVVIEEGMRAKVYKRLSDDSRMKTSYSAYQTLRQGLYTSECGDIGGYS